MATETKPLGYRWDHAVNSTELLAKVKSEIHAASARGFHDSDYVNAIEADIIWSERQQLPVMGHPPQTDSELTLQTFLDEMSALTALFKEAGDAVGVTPMIVKLDFKSSKGFEASYDALRKFIASSPFPRGVFVNADILVGPANTRDILFDAKTFLHASAALGSLDGPNDHKIVLSVGWTTSNATDEEIYRPYTHEMVDEMLHVLKPYEHLHVTFPLRATSCRESWAAIRKLLEGPKTYGYTLWWAKTQMTDAEIEWLYHTLEETKTSGTNELPYANRTFYDILGFEAFLARRKK